MTDQTVRSSTAPDFDDFYGGAREPVYKALALVLRDRDLATEAADAGLARAHQRWRKVRNLDHPDAWTFGAALRWAGRKARSDGERTHGFRLERGDDGGRDEAALDAFGGLALSYRTALVVADYLRWDDAAAGIALGINSDQVAGRMRRARGALGEALRMAPEQTGERLGPALRAEADRHAVPLSRLETTRTRGWLRRLTVAAGAAAATAVIVGGTIVGVGALAGDDPAEPTGTTGPVTFAEIGSIADFEWQRIPLGGAGEAQQITGGENGFLAFGQDWNSGRMNAWSSPDGLAWGPTASPMSGNNGYIQSLSTGPAGFIAVGSRWDEFGGGGEEILVFTSTDGESWVESRLVEGSGEGERQIGGIWVYRYAYPQAAVAGPSGFLVIVEENTDFDPAPLLDNLDLPDGVDPWNWGYGWDGERLVIYGANGQEVFAATVEELGIDPEVAAMLGNRRRVFTSTDGSEWSEIESEGPFGPQSWVRTVIAGPDGYVAVIESGGGIGPFGAGSSAAYFSRDGSDWQEIAFDGRPRFTSGAAVDERFLLFGTDRSGAGVWSSTDGVAWTRSDAALPAEIYQVAAGPLGVVAIGQSEFETQVAVLEKDGWTIEMAQDGSYTFLDGAGDIVYVLYAEDLVYRTGAAGPDGDPLSSDTTVATASDAAEPATTLAPAIPTEPGFPGGMVVDFIDPDTGEVIATVTEEEIYRAWEQVWMVAEPRFEDSGYTLYHSVDGIEWSSTALADTIGSGFYPNWVAVGTGAVVLTGYEDRGGFGGFFEGQPTPFLWVGAPGS